VGAMATTRDGGGDARGEDDDGRAFARAVGAGTVTRRVVRARGRGRDAEASGRRGERTRARGLVKPRGMTDEEFQQMQREQDEQYKLFSEKAKRRMAKKGPMEGDVKGTSDYVSTQSLGAPIDEEPNWKSYDEMTMQEFVRAVDKGLVKSFQVWDAPQFGWFPPERLRKIPRSRYYLVTMKGSKGKQYYLNTLTNTMDAALLDKCDRLGAWYTYHQKWRPSSYSGMEFLAYSVGGLAFMIGSIYLGIVRRTSVPQDQFQAMQFAQSRAGARRDGTVDVTLEDVGGLENIIEDLEEVVAFLKEPERFAKVGARPPKGLLMEGGPGVGKTLIAKAIAGEAKVPFYSMSGSEFVEIIVGVGAARVRDLFKRARINAPCLIFVDEIDALGTKRAAAGTRGTEEHEQTLNQLLTEMDGFTPDTGVVFIGATNRADLLDPALLRPGRFDRKVRVGLPNVEARAKILQIHLSKRNCNPEIDTKRLAQNLPGLSGAEIANICNEAAVHCVRRQGEQIEEHDVLDAVERVVSGIRLTAHPKESVTTRKLAAHEVGHALVQNLLHKSNGLIEDIEMISIIPRGFEPAITLIQRKRDEDYRYPTRARMCERVQVLLAGRSCEKVLFGEASTRGSEDVCEANDLLRNMIVNFGLGQPGMMTTYTYDPKHLNKSERRVARLQGAVSKSGELMPLDELLTIAGPIREVVPDHYQYAERKMVQILQEAEANCLAIIAAHEDAVNAMVDRLIENETLSLAEFEEILAAHPPKGEFSTIGPDTPAKVLPTEATEDLIGMRSIADPKEKIKAAAKYYNVDITKDEPKLRNAETFKQATGLGEYLRPFSEQSIQKWQYEVSPSHTWNHLAIQETDKEDPEWRVKEVIRVCREADDDRTIELRGILSSIEAKRDAGEELSEFDKRRVEACEAEIARYAEKWSGEGWKPTPHDLSYSVMFDDPDLAKSEYHFWADMPRYTQDALYNMGRRIDRMAKMGETREDPEN
jgi:cell division protease FtsH